MAVSAHLGLEISNVLLSMAGLQLEVPPVHSEGRLHWHVWLHHKPLHRQIHSLTGAVETHSVQTEGGINYTRTTLQIKPTPNNVVTKLQTHLNGSQGQRV